MRILGYLALAASSAVLLTLAAGSASAQEKKLKLGTEGAYPPFNYATPTASSRASTSTSETRCALR